MPNSTPQEWKITRFGDFADNIAERVEPSETDLEIYVGLEHLDSETLEIKRHGKTSDVEGTKLEVKPGDIIFGRRRAYQRKVAIADFKGICSAHAMILRPKKNMRKDFFPFFLQSEMFMDRAMKISVGSLSPTINWKTLKKQEFPLPTIQEQRIMAVVLWSLEESIRKKDEIIDSGVRYKKALMKHLFTYGAVGFDHVGKTKMKKAKIGLVPDAWEVVRLGDVSTNFISGGTPSTKNPSYWNGNIPWMTSAHINGRTVTQGMKHITEIGLKNSATKVVPKNSILMATRVGIGKIAISLVDIAISQDITGVVLDRKKINVEFVYWLLSNYANRLRTLSQGTTIKGLLRKKIKNLIIPLPPLHEQQKIAEILSKLDRNIEAAEKHKISLIALKKRLLNGLLSGEIRFRGYHK